MKRGTIGAVVQFCGHNGSFIADIYVVGNTNVVHAAAPVSPATLNRTITPTHHISDFPNAGVWKPHHGFFVVPEAQVREL